MAGRSVSPAALETCRERIDGADEESQSNLYYLRLWGEIQAKVRGRNHAANPGQSRKLFLLAKNSEFCADEVGKPV
jgi:hypothetical protein